MSCLKCKTNAVPPENGAKAPLCRECRAGMILSGDEVRLGTLDRAYADQCVGKSTTVTWEELMSLDPVSPFGFRRIRCNICGGSEPYDPMKSRQGWPCERCHRHGLGCCMAYVVHKEFGLQARAMCKMCRAELMLSGVPCEESTQAMPGTKESIAAIPPPEPPAPPAPAGVNGPMAMRVPQATIDAIRARKLTVHNVQPTCVNCRTVVASKADLKRGWCKTCREEREISRAEGGQA